MNDADTALLMWRTAVWEFVYGAGECALPAVERWRARYLDACAVAA